MSRIPILPALMADNELEARRNYYKKWRKNNTDLKAPFFALFKSFKDTNLLSSLDEGALRLYLYFGLISGNDEGTNWHSIQTIADYFGTQTRTIDNWIKKLTEAGLIYRKRDGKKSHTTFLIPYTDAVIDILPQRRSESDDQELLEDLLYTVDSLAAVYGPVIKVFHIFHWGWVAKDKKIVTDRKTANMLLLITYRNDGILVGHRYWLRKSGDYGISQLGIDEVAIFDSPFVYNDKKVTGVAVNHEHNLRSPDATKSLIGLIQDLSKVEEDELSHHPRVEYGLIDEILEIEDNDESLET